MTPHDLIAAFDAVVEAPDGVARLRELVRQLAVDGKLVQSASREWPTATLAELVDEFQNGTSSRGGEGGPPVVVLRLADIKQGRIAPTSLRRIDLSPESARKYSVRDGDVLAIRVNGSGDLVGRLIVIGRAEGWCYCDHFIRIRLHANTLSPHFLRLFGDTPGAREHLSRVTVTTAGQKTVNQKGLGSLRVPLPPLAEQNRIVARVDELMGLLDRLEAARTSRDATRSAVRDSALNALREADTPDEVEVAWNRFAERMDDLLCDPADIAPLRQTVLQLAVRGKLVPQDPTDKPASVLLERIAAERARLAEAGTIRKPVLLPPVAEDEVPFEVPQAWAWCRLADVGDWGAGATPRRGATDYYGGPHLWFKSGELPDGPLGGPSEETVTDRALADCSLRRNAAGDVLIAMYGATIGKLALLMEPATTNQAVCACTTLPGVWNRYLFVFLRASRGRFAAAGAGGAQPNISKEKIVATAFPLPPLAEQHRIVARVDELMRLLDQVEERLAAARRTHAAFATAAVHHLDA